MDRNLTAFPPAAVDRRSDLCLPNRVSEVAEKRAERAILISVATPDRDAVEVQDSLRELSELATTAGAEIVEVVVQRRDSPDPACFIGRGKAAEIAQLSKELECDLVIVDDELAPTQRRKLEDAVGVRVIDRTELILDIFAKRARTREGKLQVELAQLTYRLPRLSGLGSELSRLGGGIGTRGPGETKLETDRRRIRRRITELKLKLEDLRKQRKVQRTLRDKSNLPVVALCGYTNAGKSSLLDLLVRIHAMGVERFVNLEPGLRARELEHIEGSGVLIEDRLFATLDPTVRRVSLPGGQEFLIVDTVGFIQRLPHELIAAFRATLDEITEADLLLHVIDASDSRLYAKIEEGVKTLSEIGADAVPVIRVLNKIDLVSDSERARLARDEDAVLISTLTTENVDALLYRIAGFFERNRIRARFLIPYGLGSVENAIRTRGLVESVEYRDSGVLIEARVGNEVASKYSDYIVAREG